MHNLKGLQTLGNQDKQHLNIIFSVININTKIPIVNKHLPWSPSPRRGACWRRAPLAVTSHSQSGGVRPLSRQPRCSFPGLSRWGCAHQASRRSGDFCGSKCLKASPSSVVPRAPGFPVPWPEGLEPFQFPGASHGSWKAWPRGVHLGLWPGPGVTW